MLKALLREHHLQNYAMFTRAYRKAARGVDKDLVETYPSRATLHRWMAGQVTDLPHPHHCAVLEAMLPGWTAAELFRPYVGPDQVEGSTLLRELLRRRFIVHYRDFCQAYDLTAATINTDLVSSYPSQQQFLRWVSGDMTGLPYPDHCNVLEAMFPGYTARQLFAVDAPAESVTPEPVSTTVETGPALVDQVAVPLVRHNGLGTARPTVAADGEGQVIAVSADRARDFLSRIEVPNVGAETIDQFFDDLRHLLFAYLQQPLPTLLDDLVDTQNRAFGLLEGHQRPDQTRDLYLVAGITCGLMTMASRDFGATQDAMTQARTGYACADNAGHDGLRAWIRGLQSNIAYWAGRWDDALRYVQLGVEAANRTRSTAAVLLASSEARTLGALNRFDEAHAAVARAAEARERLQPDELDVLGGLCNFIRPNQLNYAAEAFSWGGAPQAGHAERFAQESLETYPAVFPGGSFRNESTARCALAIARVSRREVDGAAEVLAPVLALPGDQRDHTVVTAVERVRTVLRTVKDPARDVIDLAEALDASPPNAWHCRIDHHSWIVHRQQGRQLVPFHRGDDPDRWLDLAYEPCRSLITQVDDGDPAGPGLIGDRISSSASQPNVVALMPAALDAGAGMRVCEIGTGTGYNAALLAHRLGAENVITIEVDAALADRARVVLTDAGYPRVAVVTGDGAQGYPSGAPYDRVLSTAAVGQVPYAWITQTRPSGRVITPWGTPYLNGALVSSTW